MSSKQDAEQRRIEDSSAFPAMATALEEVRRNYDIEQARKSNIEVKIGAIVGVDALLISVVGVFGQLHLLTTIVVLVPALLALGYGLETFNSRKYWKPGPKVDEIFGHARLDEVNAQKEFIQNYRQAIKHNNKQNNDRMDTLDTCFLLTVISFLLLLLTPILDGFLRTVVAQTGV